MNDDTHDKLVKAYLEYFKANEKWESGRSYRAYYATQKWLRQIRKLAKARDIDNRTFFYENVNSKTRGDNQ